MANNKHNRTLLLFSPRRQSILRFSVALGSAKFTKPIVFLVFFFFFSVPLLASECNRSVVFGRAGLSVPLLAFLGCVRQLSLNSSDTIYNLNTVHFYSFVIFYIIIISTLVANNVSTVRTYRCNTLFFFFAIRDKKKNDHVLLQNIYFFFSSQYLRNYYKKRYNFP